MQGQIILKVSNLELLLFATHHHNAIDITIKFHENISMVKVLRSKQEVCAICNAAFIKWSYDTFDTYSSHEVSLKSYQVVAEISCGHEVGTMYGGSSH